MVRFLDCLSTITVKTLMFKKDQSNLNMVEPHYDSHRLVYYQENQDGRYMINIMNFIITHTQHSTQLEKHLYHTMSGVYSTSAICQGLLKAAISPRIVLVPIVPDPFLVDRPHFCENSREPASTGAHYPITFGEDLARSPQSSEGRVLKKWCWKTCWKTCGKTVADQKPSGP